MKLQNLRTLDVSFNIIEKLILTTVPNLRVLNISNNHLTSVSITELKELEEVNLSVNNLTHMFTLNSFENLPKLKILNLGFNKICSIEIGELEINLHELRTLNLENNYFEMIESLAPLKNMEHFDKLKDLNLCKNPFMSAPKLKTPKGNFSVKTQFLREFRHLTHINGKPVETKHLKKAYDYDKHK